MQHDIIDRYIYAATKKMPKKIQEDVESELRSLIEDMLQERCGDVLPTEKDLYMILMELGSPQELYEKYNTDAKKCLIGQPYYDSYLFLLKVVLPCVVFGLTLASAMNYAMGQSGPWHGAVLQWAFGLLSALLIAFAFVTLLFAFFYYKGISLDSAFDPHKLPPVPKKQQTISPWNPIIGIGFSVIFIIVFLAMPQIFSTPVEGGWLAVFNVEHIKNAWYIIVLFALLGITREIVKLVEGRFNKRVMVTSVTTNALAALLAIWWLRQEGLINATFIEKIATIATEDSDIVVRLFTNFHILFLVVMLFALLLDTLMAVVKAYKQ